MMTGDDRVDFRATTGRALPRVSVIVPAFNAERTLGECLRSLFDQSLEPVEVTVVDDASTDRTAWVAHEIGARVLRMIRNGGPGLARNAGTSAATGDILAFIDADCVARSDWLYGMVGILTRENVGAVTGGYGGMVIAGFVERLQYLSLKIRQSTLPPRINSTISSNLVCRRDFFEDVRGFPLYYTRRAPERAVWGNEDEEFGFLAAERGESVAWASWSAVLHRFRPTVGGYLKQQRFYAERIVMSMARQPAMLLATSNYSRGSGAAHVAVTGLVPVALTAAVAASATDFPMAPQLWAVAGICLGAYLLLPFRMLASLKALGQPYGFLVRAYPVLLGVDVAWFMGVVAGTLHSSGGFIVGSRSARSSPPALVIHDKVASYARAGGAFGAVDSLNASLASTRRGSDTSGTVR